MVVWVATELDEVVVLLPPELLELLELLPPELEEPEDDCSARVRKVSMVLLPPGLARR